MQTRWFSFDVTRSQYYHPSKYAHINTGDIPEIGGNNIIAKIKVL